MEDLIKIVKIMGALLISLVIFFIVTGICTGIGALAGGGGILPGFFVGMVIGGILAMKIIPDLFLAMTDRMFDEEEKQIKPKQHEITHDLATKKSFNHKQIISQLSKNSISPLYKAPTSTISITNSSSIKPFIPRDTIPSSSTDTIGYRIASILIDWFLNTDDNFFAFDEAEQNRDVVYDKTSIMLANRR